MKIIQITDTHLLGNKSNLFGIDTYSMLEKALISIKKNHKDASFLVITGDLVHKAKLEAYMQLKELLDDFFIPIYLIIGNHDDKNIFNKVFDTCRKNEFVQYTISKNKNKFLFLDTSVKNEEYGTLCKERLKFLKNEIENSLDKNIYIFMHHFPLNSKLPWMEKNAPFKKKKSFWNILGKYKNVKYIFSGHLHRNINAMYNGVGVHCAKSTNFQVAYTPNSNEDYINKDEKPSYSIIDIDDNLVLLHNHEYLSEDMVFIPNGY